MGKPWRLCAEAMLWQTPLIMQRPRYTLKVLLAQCEAVAQPMPRVEGWDEMPAVGREVLDAHTENHASGDPEAAPSANKPVAD